MDEDEFMEPYDDPKNRETRRIETDHAAARFAQEPERALEAMQEEDRGFAFSVREVKNYILDLSAEGRDESDKAPVLDSMEDSETYIDETVRDALKGAADGEEYAMRSTEGGSAFNATRFAYIGDTDYNL
jgi:hypothetical protein